MPLPTPRRLTLSGGACGAGSIVAVDILYWLDLDGRMTKIDETRADASILRVAPTRIPNPQSSMGAMGVLAPTVLCK